MKSIFSRHGICDILTIDQGPQYTSTLFREFMAEYGIKHVTNSAKYPLGNAEAERGVQTVKRLLKKADDPYIALMNYPTTPLSNGWSPSELLFSCRIKTLVPINPAKLKPRTVKERNL